MNTDNKKNTSNFHQGFYWGAATASYQVEGFNENCDWAQAAKEGKVPGAGRLADHYHRYEEDFDIAKELGHNAHRFQLSGGELNHKKGCLMRQRLIIIEKFLKHLKKRGITPFITLWHFTLPIWFAESGGFERKDSPEVFARYCAYVVEELGDLCDHYSTINEPNVWAGHGWLYGAWPPFKRSRIFGVKFGKDDGSTARVGATPRFKHIFLYFTVERNLVRSHIAAYKAIKEVVPTALVSIVKHVRWFTSDDRLVNKMKATVMQYLQSDRYMGKIKDHIDEIGLNYYRHTKFGDNKNYLHTDMGWKVYPSGMHGALLTLKKYKLPVFVSEAGVADEADTIRAQYIAVQAASMKRAIKDGVDVQGYMYWSLIDNYEWALGINKKFGLVEINYGTLERTIRPSAYAYKALIEAAQKS